MNKQNKEATKNTNGDPTATFVATANNWSKGNSASENAAKTIAIHGTTKAIGNSTIGLALKLAISVAGSNDGSPGVDLDNVAVLATGSYDTGSPTYQQGLNTYQQQPATMKQDGVLHNKAFNDEINNY